MRNKKEHRNFLNHSVFIGIAIITVSILLGTYFLGDKAINYKEIPYDVLVEDGDLYDTSKQPDWHIINLGF